MMIESPCSLNNATTPFLTLSRFGLFALTIAASPSSLYKPTPLLSKTALQQVKSNKVHKLRLNHKIPSKHQTINYFFSLLMQMFYRKGEIYNDDNINNWVAEGSYRPRERNGTIKQLFRYWWIKFNHVKLCKMWLAFLWRPLKPVYDGGSISPLIEFDGVFITRDNFFQMFFNNKSYIVFHRIYWSAFGVTSKVWFVIFKW